MEEELNYLQTIGVTKREEVTDETFMLCKTKFDFITDLANITERKSICICYSKNNNRI